MITSVNNRVLEHIIMENSTNNSRRKFIYTLGGASLGVATFGLSGCGTGKKGSDEPQAASDTPAAGSEMFFKISLAQWSLHNALNAGEFTNLDFPAMAKNEFGIEGVEYVNQFFKDKAENQRYLQDLKTRCSDNGVTSVLIMVDREGDLGDLDDGKRLLAVENHYKWIHAAKFLGCHSIRVNAAGSGTAEEVSASAIDGLGKLSEYGAKENINVIVENHGGYSSNGQWLTNVISQVGLDNCGTLPDFGNFCIERTEEGCANEYDRYKGLEELMPFAKGVSAKSHEFDENGNEVRSDYKRMLQTVKNAGYKGYIGIEYEGNSLSEPEGIMATKRLLERIGKEIG